MIENLREELEDAVADWSDERLQRLIRRAANDYMQAKRFPRGWRRNELGIPLNDIAAEDMIFERAIVLVSRRGWEAQRSHSENSINRVYDDTDWYARITPFVSYASLQPIVNCECDPEEDDGP